ncbi:hypothetical protein GOP47_0031034 [Adiantum capillus-veneris]|nr:hypothetical protein GOP47_0031034 [Adiantum capillus-veneris]
MNKKVMVKMMVALALHVCTTQAVLPAQTQPMPLQEPRLACIGKLRFILPGCRQADMDDGLPPDPATRAGCLPLPDTPRVQLQCLKFFVCSPNLDCDLLVENLRPLTALVPTASSPDDHHHQQHYSHPYRAPDSS